MDARVRFVCFDTATDALACALWLDGEVIGYDRIAPRQHADRVLSEVDRLLAGAGVPRSALDAVGFGRGPGSFTGLRIAAGVAQGLAFALDVPAVPISSLAVIAQGALRENGSRKVLALLDARLGEVYAGACKADEGVMRPIRGERLCLPAELAGYLEGEGGWTGCGPGWNVCSDALASGLDGRLERLDPNRLPQARDLATLVHAARQEGLVVAPEHALPVYLRRQVVRRPERAAGAAP